MFHSRLMNPYCSPESVARGLYRNMCSYPYSYKYGTVELKPRVDISEDKENKYITVELPGIAKEEVSITITDDMLLIKGEKKQSAVSDDVENVWSERRFGSFSRSFMLSDNIDKDNIQAKFDNGILEIALPKKESAKEKNINIQ